LSPEKEELGVNAPTPPALDGLLEDNAWLDDELDGLGLQLGTRVEGDGTRPECTQDVGDGATHVFAELGAGEIRELGDGDLPALTVEEGLGPYNGRGGLEGLGDVHPGTRDDGDGDLTTCVGDGDGNVAEGAGAGDRCGEGDLPKAVHPSSAEWSAHQSMTNCVHAVECGSPRAMQSDCTWHGEAGSQSCEKKHVLSVDKGEGVTGDGFLGPSDP
jgi:hypothetical protein